MQSVEEKVAVFGIPTLVFSAQKSPAFGIPNLDGFK
jgi:hypothetical protein